MQVVRTTKTQPHLNRQGLPLQLSKFLCQTLHPHHHLNPQRRRPLRRQRLGSRLLLLRPKTLLIQILNLLRPLLLPRWRTYVCTSLPLPLGLVLRSLPHSNVEANPHAIQKAANADGDAVHYGMYSNIESVSSDIVVNEALGKIYSISGCVKADVTKSPASIVC